MAINDKKDSVNTCKIMFTRVCTYKPWKNKKMQEVTPDLWHLCVLWSVGIRFSWLPGGRASNLLFNAAGKGSSWDLPMRMSRSLESNLALSRDSRMPPIAQIALEMQAACKKVKNCGAVKIRQITIGQIDVLPKIRSAKFTICWMILLPKTYYPSSDFVHLLTQSSHSSRFKGFFIANLA